MAWLRRVMGGFKALFRRDRGEQELDEELRAYLEMSTNQKMRAGMAPKDAIRSAHVEMGSLEAVKDYTRDAGWESFIETIWQDVRYAIRTLRRSRAFAATALLTLGLGIGANTAIFSVMNAVMLKSLPVENPERLVLLQYVSTRNTPREVRRTSSGYGAPSLPLAAFQRFRQDSETLATVFGFVPLGFNDQSVAVNTNGEVGLAAGEMVSGEYFSGLGVLPILGRPILRTDERPDAARIAVISYGYWSRRFARDPSVIGKDIALNTMPFTIVGVAAPEFFGVNPALAADIWIPLRDGLGLTPWGIQTPPGESLFADRTWWWVMVGGRLKPGVTRQQARTELDLLFRRSITEGLNPLPPIENIPHLELVSGSGGIRSLRQAFSQPLFVLMAAVVLVLLIAGANVATLLLARAAARQQEMSVRLATGASRARLIRQLLTESVVLAAIGGALGLLFAQWGSRSLLLLMSGGRQAMALDVRPDTTVFAFTAAVCVVISTLFGLAPAFRATRVGLTQDLREGTRRSSPRLGLSKTLIVGQVALSLLLLIGAGLFLRTINHLVNVDVGFEPRNLLLFGLDPRRGDYAQDHVALTYQQVLENLATIPGVRSATASEQVLLSGWTNNASITTDGPPLESGQSTNVYSNRVAPAFFETMGIPNVLGRGIEWRDVQGRRNVVVMNENMARHFFPNQSPLGHHVMVRTSSQPAEPFEIIGVVGNAKYNNLRDEPPRTMYLPYTAGRTLGRLFFEVRTMADPAKTIPAVRGVVRRIDPELPLIDIKTQTDQIDESLTRERMFARLASFFAVLALLLVSVGLYGTLAYGVTRRSNEIGIRMALGAQRLAVLWMILRESLLLMLLGMAIGLPLAVATTRFIAGQLYGVKPSDPATLTAAVVVLGTVGTLAGYLPARRATKVDPLTALRYE